MLYRMSSELPGGIREVAHDFGYVTVPGSRGSVFNAKVEDRRFPYRHGPSNMR